jgi:hypothetical protein
MEEIKKKRGVSATITMFRRMAQNWRAEYNAILVFIIWKSIDWWEYILELARS